MTVSLTATDVVVVVLYALNSVTFHLLLAEIGKHSDLPDWMRGHWRGLTFWMSLVAPFAMLGAIILAVAFIVRSRFGGDRAP